MCGIFAYIGPGRAVENVLEGLERLEYRGYDSSGISCLMHSNLALKSFKAVGKISELKKILPATIDTHVAVGHTRWATHGKVSLENAHPHIIEDHVLIHNGIIENVMELKKKFSIGSSDLLSQTDSEVFLKLFMIIKQEMKGQADCNKKAFQKTFSLVRGNSAFILCIPKEGIILGAKCMAPLVIGENRNSGEFYISSDPYALVNKAHEIYFPEDNVLFDLKFGANGLWDQIEFFELGGEVSNRVRKGELDTNLEVSQKGAYEHFMLKEICEQPELIQKFSLSINEESYLSRLRSLESLFFKAKKVYIVGCGTAWHAALCMNKLFEELLGISLHVELASEFRYSDRLVGEGDLAFFISQSGETLDTLAAQKMMKQAGAKTVAIVNVKNSTLFRECDLNFEINAGQEIGVASTKAFTQMVLVGHVLASFLSQSSKNILRPRQMISEQDLIRDLQKKYQVLSSEIYHLLLGQNHLKELAEKIAHFPYFVFLGRKKLFPIALEGALKLKEIAYIPTEGYAAGELKHGPIALIDEQVMTIVLIDHDLFDKTYSNIEEIHARRGHLLVVGPQDKEEMFKNNFDHFYGINMLSTFELTPIYSNVVLQLISYYIAKFKGTEIDRPRNLAKSVTVE